MKIAIFVSARSELGLFYWTIKELDKNYDVETTVYIGGGLVSKTFSTGTSNDFLLNFSRIKIEAIPYLLDGYSYGHLSKSIGVGIISLAQEFLDQKPDLLIILGDRYDLFIPASVATVNKIPVVHLCGGDITYGAIDNNIRYSISKLSHIHVVQNYCAAHNISKTGEEDWRIVVAGGPGVENIYRLDLPERKEIKNKFCIDLNEPTILCTFHPTTLEENLSIEEQVHGLFESLSHFRIFNFVFTYPGAEVGSDIVIKKIEQFSNRYNNVYFFKDLGIRNYLGIMKYSKVVLGNSSSGILEAPSFGVPTVNIGRRQEGRVRACSVIDCGYSKDEIINAVEQALRKDFAEKLVKCKNPYDPYNDGKFSERFIKILHNLPNRNKLLNKKLVFEVEKNEWNKLLKEK